MSIGLVIAGIYVLISVVIGCLMYASQQGGWVGFPWWYCVCMGFLWPTIPYFWVRNKVGRR